MNWTARQLGSFVQCCAAEDGYEACGLPRGHAGDDHIYSGDRVTGLSFAFDSRAALRLRRAAWFAKLPPADVIAFYVRGPGCVRFAS